MRFSERDIEEIVNRVYKEFKGDIKKAAKEMCLREQTISIYIKSQNPTLKTRPETNYYTKLTNNQTTQPEQQIHNSQIIKSDNNYQKNKINTTKLDRDLINKTENFAEKHYRNTPFTKSFIFVLKRMYEGSTTSQVEKEMVYTSNTHKFTEKIIQQKLQKYQKEYNVTTPTQLYEKIFK